MKVWVLFFFAAVWMQMPSEVSTNIASLSIERPMPNGPPATPRQKSPNALYNPLKFVTGDSYRKTNTVMNVTPSSQSALPTWSPFAKKADTTNDEIEVRSIFAPASAESKKVLTENKHKNKGTTEPLAGKRRRPKDSIKPNCSGQPKSEVLRPDASSTQPGNSPPASEVLRPDASSIQPGNNPPASEVLRPDASSIQPGNSPPASEVSGCDAWSTWPNTNSPPPSDESGNNGCSTQLNVDPKSQLKEVKEVSNCNAGVMGNTIAKVLKKAPKKLTESSHLSKISKEPQRVTTSPFTPVPPFVDEEGPCSTAGSITSATTVHRSPTNRQLSSSGSALITSAKTVHCSPTNKQLPSATVRHSQTKRALVQTSESVAILPATTVQGNPSATNSNVPDCGATSVSSARATNQSSGLTKEDTTPSMKNSKKHVSSPVLSKPRSTIKNAKNAGRKQVIDHSKKHTKMSTSELVPEPTQNLDNKVREMFQTESRGALQDTTNESFGSDIIPSSLHCEPVGKINKTTPEKCAKQSSRKGEVSGREGGMSNFNISNKSAIEIIKLKQADQSAKNKETNENSLDNETGKLPTAIVTSTSEPVSNETPQGSSTAVDKLNTLDMNTSFSSVQKAARDGKASLEGSVHDSHSSVGSTDGIVTCSEKSSYVYYSLKKYMPYEKDKTVGRREPLDTCFESGSSKNDSQTLVAVYQPDSSTMVQNHALSMPSSDCDPNTVNQNSESSPDIGEIKKKECNGKVVAVQIDEKKVVPTKALKPKAKTNTQPRTKNQEEANNAEQADKVPLLDTAKENVDDKVPNCWDTIDVPRAPNSTLDVDLSTVDGARHQATSKPEYTLEVVGASASKNAEGAKPVARTAHMGVDPEELKLSMIGFLKGIDRKNVNNSISMQESTKPKNIPKKQKAVTPKKNRKSVATELESDTRRSVTKRRLFTRNDEVTQLEIPLEDSDPNARKPPPPKRRRRVLKKTELNVQPVKDNVHVFDTDRSWAKEINEPLFPADRSWAKDITEPLFPTSSTKKNLLDDSSIDEFEMLLKATKFDYKSQPAKRIDDNFHIGSDSSDNGKPNDNTRNVLVKKKKKASRDFADDTTSDFSFKENVPKLKKTRKNSLLSSVTKDDSARNTTAKTLQNQSVGKSAASTAKRTKPSVVRKNTTKVMSIAEKLSSDESLPDLIVETVPSKKPYCPVTKNDKHRAKTGNSSKRPRKHLITDEVVDVNAGSKGLHEHDSQQPSTSSMAALNTDTSHNVVVNSSLKNVIREQSLPVNDGNMTSSSKLLKGTTGTAKETTSEFNKASSFIFDLSFESLCEDPIVTEKPIAKTALDTAQKQISVETHNLKTQMKTSSANLPMPKAARLTKSKSSKPQMVNLTEMVQASPLEKLDKHKSARKSKSSKPQVEEIANDYVLTEMVQASPSEKLDKHKSARKSKSSKPQVEEIANDYVLTEMVQASPSEKLDKHKSARKSKSSKPQVEEIANDYVQQDLPEVQPVPLASSAIPKQKTPRLLKSKPSKPQLEEIANDSTSSMAALNTDTSHNVVVNSSLKNVIREQSLPVNDGNMTSSSKLLKGTTGTAKETTSEFNKASSFIFDLSFESLCEDPIVTEKPIAKTALDTAQKQISVETHNLKTQMKASSANLPMPKAARLTKSKSSKPQMVNLTEMVQALPSEKLDKHKSARKSKSPKPQVEEIANDYVQEELPEAQPVPLASSAIPKQKTPRLLKSKPSKPQLEEIANDYVEQELPEVQPVPLATSAVPKKKTPRQLKSKPSKPQPEEISNDYVEEQLPKLVETVPMEKSCIPKRKLARLTKSKSSKPQVEEITDNGFEEVAKSKWKGIPQDNTFVSRTSRNVDKVELMRDLESDDDEPEVALLKPHHSERRRTLTRAEDEALLAVEPSPLHRTGFTCLAPSENPSDQRISSDDSDSSRLPLATIKQKNRTESNKSERFGAEERALNVQNIHSDTGNVHKENISQDKSQKRRPMHSPSSNSDSSRLPLATIKQKNRTDPNKSERFGAEKSALNVQNIHSDTRNVHKENISQDKSQKRRPMHSPSSNSDSSRLPLATIKQKNRTDPNKSERFGAETSALSVQNIHSDTGNVHKENISQDKSQKRRPMHSPSSNSDSSRLPLATIKQKNRTDPNKSERFGVEKSALNVQNIHSDTGNVHKENISQDKSQKRRPMHSPSSNSDSSRLPLTTIKQKNRTDPNKSERFGAETSALSVQNIHSDTRNVHKENISQEESQKRRPMHSPGLNSDSSRLPLTTIKQKNRTEPNKSERLGAEKSALNIQNIHSDTESAHKENISQDKSQKRRPMHSPSSNSDSSRLPLATIKQKNRTVSNKSERLGAKKSALSVQNIHSDTGNVHKENISRNKSQKRRAMHTSSSNSDDDYNSFQVGKSHCSELRSVNNKTYAIPSKPSTSKVDKVIASSRKVIAIDEPQENEVEHSGEVRQLQRTDKTKRFSNVSTRVPISKTASRASKKTMAIVDSSCDGSDDGSVLYANNGVAAKSSLETRWGGDGSESGDGLEVIKSPPLKERQARRSGNDESNRPVCLDSDVSIRALDRLLDAVTNNREIESPDRNAPRHSTPLVGSMGELYAAYSPIVLNENRPDFADLDCDRSDEITSPPGSISLTLGSIALEPLTPAWANAAGPSGVKGRLVESAERAEKKMPLFSIDEMSDDECATYDQPDMFIFGGAPTLDSIGAFYKKKLAHKRQANINFAKKTGKMIYNTFNGPTTVLDKERSKLNNSVKCKMLAQIPVIKNLADDVVVLNKRRKKIFDQFVQVTVQRDNTVAKLGSCMDHVEELGIEYVNNSEALLHQQELSYEEEAKRVKKHLHETLAKQSKAESSQAVNEMLTNFRLAFQ